MFTFSLTCFTTPLPFQHACNRTYALPTLLPASALTKARKKRVRLSKFYKSKTVGIFGTFVVPYLIENKDGRFYSVDLAPTKNRKLIHESFYKEFRNWIKIGEWVETTPEKELAAN